MKKKEFVKGYSVNLRDNSIRACPEKVLGLSGRLIRDVIRTFAQLSYLMLVYCIATSDKPSPPPSCYGETG